MGRLKYDDNVAVLSCGNITLMAKAALLQIGWNDAYASFAAGRYIHVE